MKFVSSVYLPLGQEEVLAALRQANPIDYQPENYEVSNTSFDQLFGISL